MENLGLQVYWSVLIHRKEEGEVTKLGLGLRFLMLLLFIGLLLVSNVQGRNVTSLVETAVLSLWALPTPGSLPSGIDLDSVAGGVYFAEFDANQIGRLDPFTNLITEWPVTGGPNDLAVARAWDSPRTILPLPQIYFTTSLDNQIGWLSPLGSHYSSETVPTPGSFPNRLVVGTARSDLIELWFSERMANQVGRLSTGGFTFDVLRPTTPTSRIVLPSISLPSPITTTVVPQATPGNPMLGPAAMLAPEGVFGPFSEWDLSLAFSGGSSFVESIARAADGKIWAA